MSENGNEVRVIQCTWDEFTKQVRGFGLHHYFRGQRDISWRLESPSDRRLREIRDWVDKKPEERQKEFVTARLLNFGEVRHETLESFKNYAIGSHGVDASQLRDHWDWWALGRHHGLLTPFLDWTKSPYVAAFFAFLDFADHTNPGFRSVGLYGRAFNNSQESFVAVWALSRDSEVEERNKDLRFIEDRTDKAYRQRAQSGLFTCLMHNTHFDVVEYFKSEGLASRLTRFEIRSQDVVTALADLDLMNINCATMFPDLDGAAMRANQGDAIRMMALPRSDNSNTTNGHD